MDYFPGQQPQRLRVVLTRSEILRLLVVTPSLKWCTALSVTYGSRRGRWRWAGLKVIDIDSERMRI